MWHGQTVCLDGIWRGQSVCLYSMWCDLFEASCLMSWIYDHFMFWGRHVINQCCVLAFEGVIVSDSQHLLLELCSFQSDNLSSNAIAKTMRSRFYSNVTCQSQRILTHIVYYWITLYSRRNLITDIRAAAAEHPWFEQAKPTTQEIISPPKIKEYWLLIYRWCQLWLRSSYLNSKCWAPGSVRIYTPQRKKNKRKIEIVNYRNNYSNMTGGIGRGNTFGI